jgi:hypothetical protein
MNNIKSDISSSNTTQIPISSEGSTSTSNIPTTIFPSSTQIPPQYPPINALSSCDCYSCKTNLNLGCKKNANNCDFNPYFDCVNRAQFKTQLEPSDKDGFTYINPYCISKDYAPEFARMGKSEPPVYSSQDPRLISAIHNGQVLQLDVPPIDECIKLADVYTDPRLKYYGKTFYKDYSDINAGQIMYYVDKSIEDALYHPLFENSAQVDGDIYQDVMGATYPEYYRIPTKCENLLNTKTRKYRYGLSSIDDTNETREDLIALQMRPQNRSKYSARYTGNISY